MTESLRVLHLFNSYLSTTENWIYNLIYNLPYVKTYVSSKEFLPCNFYPDKFEYLIPPFKRIRNPDRIFTLRLLNFLTSLQEPIYSLHQKSSLKGKIDLAHSHFAPVAWEYRKLVKRLQVPHVVSFYGYDYEHLPFNAPVWRNRYQILFRETDLLVCEGSHGAKMLQNMGCPEDKIRIARLGVNVENIPFWKRTKRQSELNLVQIATYTEKKGHKYSIEAFTKALVDCPNMTLTFVGKDRDGIKENLIQRIKSFDLQDKVIFEEAIGFESLYEFMKNYQVLIHPSCYSENKDCEGGAPIVLLDAQATGMPVISTLHCDIPDEVIHGKTGMLSNEKDIHALANSIKAFYMMNQDEYDIYTQNARKHAEDAFDIKRNAVNLRNIYTEIKSMNLTRT